MTIALAIGGHVYVDRAWTGYDVLIGFWAHRNAAGTHYIKYTTPSNATGRMGIQEDANQTTIYHQLGSSWGSNSDAISGGVTDWAGANLAFFLFDWRGSAATLRYYSPSYPTGRNLDGSGNGALGEIATMSRLTLGGAYFNGAFQQGALTDWAELGIATGINSGVAADAAAAYTLMAAGAKFEDVFTGIYDVFAMNPAGSAGDAQSGTYTGLVNGNTMAIVGAVTKSSRAHPVSRAAASAAGVRRSLLGIG